MRLDAETQMPAAFVVDYASPADKKSRPVRWLIVVITTASALAATLLALLAMESLRKPTA
jgi:hypothetical protein